MTQSKKAANWKRLVNYIIDIVGYLIINLVLGLLIGTIVAITGNIDFLESDAFDALSSLLALVVLFFYYFFFELLFQATPGKLITQTRVISRQEAPLEASTIALRTLIRLVPFEPFSFLFGEGWHDKWSNTMVVDK
ncbi:MAG: RDD family protein [Leptolyngbyaceae cyanobacterium]